MTSRILNRRELRKKADLVELPKGVAAAPAAVPSEKKAKKAVVAAKVKRPRAKKAPPRMRACWGVFDSTMKQVAIFPYNQRTLAEVKLADLLAKKKDSHFLSIVKEPMPELPLVEATSPAGELRP